MQRRTIRQWQESLGAQVRAARIDADLDQARLAELANVSVNTVRNLEQGKNSSTATLIAVVRALDLADWLDAFAPVDEVSPLLAFETAGRVVTRSRVARRRFMAP